MSFYRKSHFIFKAAAIFVLASSPVEASRSIMASQVRVIVNNEQTNVQAILDRITPKDTVLKDLVARVKELNVLDGIGSTVTAPHLNILTNGASADGLHTHTIGFAANADLLDSLDSGQFLRSDVSDTFAGTLLTLGGNMQLTTGGTISSSADGDITLSPNGTGEINIGEVANLTTVTLNGDITINGSLFADATFNLQRDVDAINNTLNKLESASVSGPQVKDINQSIDALKQQLESIQKSIAFDGSEKKINLGAPVTIKGELTVEGPIKTVYPSDTLGSFPIYVHESLQPTVVTRGESKLSNGIATVFLPEAFVEVSRIDKDHPLFIKTTLLSDQCTELAVVKRSANSFQVKELYQGKSNCPFQWETTAYKNQRRK